MIMKTMGRMKVEKWIILDQEERWENQTQDQAHIVKIKTRNKEMMKTKNTKTSVIKNKNIRPSL